MRQFLLLLIAPSLGIVMVGLLSLWDPDAVDINALNWNSDSPQSRAYLNRLASQVEGELCAKSKLRLHSRLDRLTKEYFSASSYVTNLVRVRTPYLPRH